ncbi:MAG: hypothetical protein SFV18_05105 [Bryobacteraceae bacterium]|nr:hypothetical protein [Bryobacteraceae bacterium]
MIAIGIDGRYIALGGHHSGVRVFDLGNLALVKRAKRTGSLNDLQFGLDSDTLAIADSNLSVVSISGRFPDRRIRSDEANYGSIRFGANDRLLLTVNGKGAVLVIDLDSLAARRLHCCTSIWGDVALTKDNTRVLWAGHWPGMVDLKSGALLGRLTPERENMTFGPISLGAGESVYLGSQDGRVYGWNLATKTLESKSPPQPGYVRTIAALGQTGWLAFADEEGQVRLWNPVTGEVRGVNGAATTTNLVYQASRGLTVFGALNGRVQFWDLLEERLVDEIQVLH